jgi:hypothetical protein
MNDLTEQDAIPGPARPEKLTVDFFQQPDGLAIHKKRGGGPRVFLSLWLLGWTVGCVVLFIVVLNEPKIGTFAFAVPFWASWLFVAALLTWMYFGKETLLLQRDQALFLRSALVKLSSRVVPRAEIQGFRECQSSHTENDEHLWGIEMVTLGKPVRFAFRLPDRERAWLIHQLNGFLATTGPVALMAEPPRGASLPTTSAGTDDDDADDDSPTADCTLLNRENTLADPPSDCDWQFSQDYDTFSFTQRGYWSLSAVGFLLFVNAFWNGIVSVFLMVLFGLMPGDAAPQGAEWWGLFVFLIPFEAVGLAMFVALIVMLLEPFRRTIWRFERHSIVHQVRWPVYRRTRSWAVDNLDRLELRGGEASSGKARKRSGVRSMQSNEGSFDLAFIANDNVDLCVISDLSEGEARWMAHVVLDQRARWFDRLTRR